MTTPLNPVLVTGLEEPEGPVFGSDGTLYVVEMGAGRACVATIDGARGTVAHGEHHGRPNGMTIDGDGNLWVAEARRGVVLCMNPDGEVLKTVTGPDGQRFLWPNDLRFGADGMLYLTDSGILDTDFIVGIAIRPDWAQARYDGAVYQVDPVDGTIVRTIDRGIRFTNGIALGPDNALFVNETIGGAVFRYDLDSTAPARELFGNVNQNDDRQGWRGPDGMAFGEDGRLYCTVYGQGDVTVLDASGDVAERIPTNGALPTNIAFHPDGSGRAVVTEVAGGCVELVSTPTRGLPLHTPSFR